MAYFQITGFSMTIEQALKHYSHVLDSIESRSCRHGKNGALLAGLAWQSCCGVSYEYWNDIAIRDQLEQMVESPAITAARRSDLAALDARLKRLLEENAVATSGDRFWENGLPFGVRE
jgi:hypothetical protein